MALLLEGQVPAWLGAARAFEGRKAAFNEGPELDELAQGRIPVLKDENLHWH